MADLFDNPMGLAGFEFVEFASPEPGVLEPVLGRLGFSKVARHRSKNVDLFRQGDINFIVNNEPRSLAWYFAAEHGPSACAMAFRVRDSHKAYARALELGAQPVDVPTGPMELRLPAVRGIGGTPLYLIDRFEDGRSIYDIDFQFIDGVERHPRGHGFKVIDHLTHNKALTAPDGKIRIPLNEEASKTTGQIEEFLMKFNGEGIQHIALLTDDLVASVDSLRAAGVPLMTAPPATYYRMLEERLPGHGENAAELSARGILLDGTTAGGSKRLLLQIFSQLLLGPVFFEFIQRKGDDGFGEGNFKALFESLERDQIERGVIQAA